MTEIICSLQNLVSLLQSIQEQNATKCEIKFINNEPIIPGIECRDYANIYNEPRVGLVFFVSLYVNGVKGIAFMPIKEVTNVESNIHEIFVISDLLKTLSPLTKIAKSDDITLKFNADTIETCVVIGNSDVNISEINLCNDDKDSVDMDFNVAMIEPEFKLTFNPQLFTTQFIKCGDNDVMTLKIATLNSTERVLFICNDHKQSIILKRKIQSNIINVVTDEIEEHAGCNVKIEDCDEEQLIEQEQKRKKLKLQTKEKINENIKLSRAFKHGINNENLNLELTLKFTEKIWVTLLSKAQNISKHPQAMLNADIINLFIDLKHSSFLHYFILPRIDDEEGGE